jgi:hypothetical protein
MAGAAGGALQTAQRIGASIGTALIATAFYHVLKQTGDDFDTAIFYALLCAAGTLLVALLLAVAELAREGSRWPVDALGARREAEDPVRSDS